MSKNLINVNNVLILKEIKYYLEEIRIEEFEKNEYRPDYLNNCYRRVNYLLDHLHFNRLFKDYRIIKETDNILIEISMNGYTEDTEPFIKFVIK